MSDQPVVDQGAEDRRLLVQALDFLRNQSEFAFQLFEASFLLPDTKNRSREYGIFLEAAIHALQSGDPSFTSERTRTWMVRAVMTVAFCWATDPERRADAKRLVILSRSIQDGEIIQFYQEKP